jgi:hypothetical protein
MEAIVLSLFLLVAFEGPDQLVVGFILPHLTPPAKDILPLTLVLTTLYRKQK